MIRNDTIAAISTGMANSGIGIVRISGPDAVCIADQAYEGKQALADSESHTIHYGHIKNEGNIVDEVLVMLMKAPRTYTGEDTVEIDCHGGRFVVQRVLETVLRFGARLAEPGEFTKRAFLNGKMDLSQAEAVMDVIQSENEYALKSSVSQLKGSIKNKINDIRNEIIYHTAFIESALDDPEHISVDGYGETLDQVMETLAGQIGHLIESADQGRILKEGIQTVILGKPNAGKSSLLNILSGRERAIVTDIEGTTRDILEEKILLGGLCLNLIDTAGIRQTEDIIEEIGVKKAKEYAENADLIIYVADASRELDRNDLHILDMIYGKKAVILLNKTDLETRLSREKLLDEIGSRWKEKDPDKEDPAGFSIPIVEVSAKEGRGMEELERLLCTMFLKGEVSFSDEIYITNVRQKEALENAQKSLLRVRESIRGGLPEDFYSIDLMDAYEALGRITGETTGEDLVNEIFSKFCMGK